MRIPKAMKHTYLAWAVTYKGEPEWNIRLSCTPRECWRLAHGKFNVKPSWNSIRTLEKRGIGTVRVRVTVVVDDSQGLYRSSGHA
jgi:hypothetical protein